MAVDKCAICRSRKPFGLPKTATQNQSDGRTDCCAKKRFRVRFAHYAVIRDIILDGCQDPQSSKRTKALCIDHLSSAPRAAVLEDNREPLDLVADRQKG